MKVIQFILTIIGAVVLYLLIRAMISFMHQRRILKSEGGMRTKYAEIVNWVFSEYPGAQIVKEKTMILCIGARAMSGKTVYWLTKTARTVTIQYQYSSGMGGDVELEWTFPEQMAQSEMIAQMNQDIIRKHKNME